MTRFLAFAVLLCVALAATSPAGSLELTAGLSAEYELTDLLSPPAQNVVSFTLFLGVVEPVGGMPYQWVILSATKKNGDTFTVRALVDTWPGDPKAQHKVRTERYILEEGGGPAREYVNVHTGRAMLPEVRGWDMLFPANKGEGKPFTDRVHYLGFDFVKKREWIAAPQTAPATVRLELRPGVSVGTGRTFRDTNGKRLLFLNDKQDYDYVSFSIEDLRELVDAGWNHFWVTPEQYEWIKYWPVFCVHPGTGDRYPEFLYRTTVLGGHAYYDEPGSRIGRTITADDTPQDLAARTFEFTLEGLDKGTNRTQRLHEAIKRRDDIALGDLSLVHTLPEWEARVSTIWYAFRAGATGAIFENRFILYQQIPYLNAHYGCEIPPAPEYLMRYYYTMMRGAARHFGCDWGVAIYGEAGINEMRMAPQEFTLAYDLGARWFWYWTSDRYGHLPYPEQVNLSRVLKGHMNRHPHRDMDALLHAATVAIALPDAYSFEWQGRMFNSRYLNMEKKNEYGVKYRTVFHNAAVEMERLLRLGVEFDIVQDADGFTGEGYEEVVYVKPDGAIVISRNGAEELRTEPRTPPRPSLQAKPAITATATKRGNTVKLSAKASGGCPPLGFDTGIDFTTQTNRRVEVIWEHYPPTGEYAMLYGSEQTVTVEEPGVHRFRAITSDAYASIADQWFDITVEK